MARYLITYHGPGMPHDPAAVGAARDAFMVWAQKTGAALVDPGSPIVGSRTVGGPSGGIGPSSKLGNPLHTGRGLTADAADRRVRGPCPHLA